MSERELDERFEALFERGAVAGADDGPAEAVWAATFSDDEVVEGLTLAELGRAIHSGRLTRDDLVWRPGLPGWKPASALPVLSQFFLPPPLTAPLRAPEPHRGLQGLVETEMSRLDSPADAPPEFMPALLPVAEDDHDEDLAQDMDAAPAAAPLPSALAPASPTTRDSERRPVPLAAVVVSLAVVAIALLVVVAVLAVVLKPEPATGPVIEVIGGVPYMRVDNHLVRLGAPDPVATPVAPVLAPIVAPPPPAPSAIVPAPAPQPTPVAKQPKAQKPPAPTPALPTPVPVKACDPLSDDCGPAPVDDNDPGLPMGQVLTQVKANIGDVHGCGAKHGAALVRVGWTIAPDGQVNNVRILGNTARTPLGDCISAKVGAWRFPTAPRKTLVSSFPFKVQGP